MYTLVVVDMQPKFATSQKQSTKDRVQELILQAIEDDAGIVFLEFLGYDKTDSKLVATVEGYKKAHFQTKQENDGSFQVIEIIKKNKLPAKTVRVCGVNTNYCVRETVQGLLERVEETGIARKIEVSKSGTNCSWDHQTGLDTMQNYYSCELID